MAGGPSLPDWTDEAKRIVRLAATLSFTLHYYHVATEHLLLAVVGVVPQDCGVIALTPDSVLDAIHEVIGPPLPNRVILSPGGQTPRFKVAVKRATDRARDASRVVDRRDLWYGLLTEPGPELQKILLRLGIAGRGSLHWLSAPAADGSETEGPL